MQFTKDKILSIRFTPDKFAKINNVSEDLNLTKSDLLRTFIDEGLKSYLENKL